MILQWIGAIACGIFLTYMLFHERRWVNILAHGIILALLIILSVQVGMNLQKAQCLPTPVKMIV